MATFKVEGLQELADEIAKRGQVSGDVMERMLKSAADIVTEGIKNSVSGHGLIDTGALHKSIRPGTVAVYSDSGTVEVWPQGNASRHGHTERNATVGFVQEYGRSYGKKHRAGVGFMAEGVDSSADRAVAAMIAIWDEAGD